MNTKTISHILFATWILVLVSICIAPVAADGAGQSAYVPNHILITFQDGADSAEILTNSPAPVEILTDFDSLAPGLYVLLLPDGFTVEEAIAYFSSQPGVLYAEPDYCYSIASQPNDPDYSELWGLKNLSDQGGASAEAAWDITTGNDSIVVAVIDSGVDINHPDLKDHIWTNPGEIPDDGIDNDGNGYIDDIHGWSFVVNSSDVMDYNFHGTLCAGIIGAVANNNYGVAGTAWNVTIMPIVALNVNGDADESAIRTGIKYAINNHADIISMSFGGASEYSQTYHNLINETEKEGIVLVAAAGNSESDNDLTPMWPASFPNDNIIAVAANNQSNGRPNFSNYGATSVDLAAPGVGIYSTFPQVSKEPGVLDPVTANKTKFGQLGDTWTEELSGNTMSLAIHGVNSSFLYYNEPITPQGAQFSLKWNATYLNLTPGMSMYYFISIRNFSEYASVEDVLNHSAEWGVLGCNYDTKSQTEESFTYTWSSTQKRLPSPSGKYYFGIYYNSSNADSHVYLRNTTIANNYTVIGHGFKAMNGTSLSTPMVSGTVALIKSINPNLTPSEIRELLISTVDKFDAWTGVVVSGGRLNITAAVMKARPELNVTFNSTGGTTVSSQKVLYGEKAIRPSPDPGKDGYAFENWYTNTTLSTKWDFDNDTIKVPTTLYANWTVNTTTVTPIVSYDDVGTATFSNTNTTYLRTTSGLISKVILDAVHEINATKPVTFTADNATLSIPDFNGYTKKEELAVFEIDANCSSNQTAQPYILINVTFKDEDTANTTKDTIMFSHYNTTRNVWDTASLVYSLSQSGATVQYLVFTPSFSPFGMGIYTVASTPVTPSSGGSSSSHHSGGSLLLQPGQTAPVVNTPTAEPTIAPTQAQSPDTPSKPVTSSTTQSTQKSPTPVFGMIAGIGVIALIYRMRR